MYQLGLVGKPNTGKTTFFSAATLVDAKIAPYPFTTIEPNKGVGYVRVKCVCREFEVRDNPRNSICIKGERFVPVEVIDVAGLVPDAWMGRGLGNKFLDELRRANVLVHVIDASGSTDSEGKPVRPNTHDPLEDVKFLEREVDIWMYQIIKKDWDKLSRSVESGRLSLVKVLAERLSGLGISESHVMKALEESGLGGRKPSLWSGEDLLTFTSYVRRISKPMIIAANKADRDEAVDNIKRLKRELKDEYYVIPTSAEAELALRRAGATGIIEYLPGDGTFKVLKEEKLSKAQLRALEYIEEKVLKRWGSTGVQEVINVAFLKLLRMIVVFPVSDENSLTDHEGRVLPDAFLVPHGTTVRDFAYLIHTEIGEKFMYAIDVRSKRRLPANYLLQHRDVIKIVVRR
ncbi:MAG: redox-regulated ATPase YchF [Thermofilum sp. ex4484_15]|nr:MAG: redox-regulated ATPase YchF [Thermofilum sp. ex4484_15]